MGEGKGRAEAPGILGPKRSTENRTGVLLHVARREDSGELVAPEEVSIMTLTTTIIDMPIQLGPDLTEQEWQQVLQGHREAAIERLQTISVTDERYAISNGQHAVCFGIPT